MKSVKIYEPNEVRINAPRLQTEKTFFILNLEIVQLCSAQFYHMKSPHKTVRDSKPNSRARVRGPIQILVPGNAF